MGNDAFGLAELRNQAIAQACAVSSPFCGTMSEMAILQQSTRRIGFLREVIGVIPAVGVDVSQCESVVGKHAPISIDAV
jgi:hypothetical protein